MYVLFRFILPVVLSSNDCVFRFQELLRGQVKQLTVAVSDLKASLDAITSMKDQLSESFYAAPEEVVVSQLNGSAHKTSEVVSEESVTLVSEQATKEPAPKASKQATKDTTSKASEEVTKESAPKASKEEPKTKKTAPSKKTATKKAPKKAASPKSKSTSVEIVNNGEDWSTFNLSTLNRKTVKDLTEYLESKVRFTRCFAR